MLLCSDGEDEDGGNNHGSKRGSRRQPEQPRILYALMKVLTVTTDGRNIWKKNERLLVRTTCLASKRTARKLSPMRIVCQDHCKSEESVES